MSEPPVLSSPMLDALPGVRHAFFTRRGGVSRGIYDSLNLGVGSGDDPEAVRENRRRAADLLRVGPEALVHCYQVHSARVLTARAPWSGGRPEADGVVTRATRLVGAVLSADCAPVLLADAEARVVAAVHAGWRGALAGVIAQAVETMTALGATPSRIVGVVGPCIARESYEVGLEFQEAFVARDGAFSRFFSPSAAADKRQFDLPSFVLSCLEAAGVGACAWIGRDTCAEEREFFSNRRAFRRGESDYGRLMSAIMLDS